MLFLLAVLPLILALLQQGGHGIFDVGSQPFQRFSLSSENRNAVVPSSPTLPPRLRWEC
jgi:hypothetical protein